MMGMLTIVGWHYDGNADNCSLVGWHCDWDVDSCKMAL